MLLNEEQRQEIIKIKDENITKELFIRLFSTIDKKKPKYTPQDKFILYKGEIRNLKESQIETTIGRYIYNVFIVDSCFDGLIPYYNKVLDGKGFNEIDTKITQLLMDGKINVRDHYVKYQTKRAWLEYTPVEVLVPGFNYQILNPSKKIEQRKKELFKQYKKELDAGDITVAAKIESELLNLAKEELKDNPAMRLYELKKPSFGNNYKNMNIMVGPLRDNATGEYYITDSNYFNGIKKEEYSYFADMGIYGAYSRSVETREGGAGVKEVMSALQSTTLNPNRDSDCMTIYTLPVKLTKENINLYIYRYISTPKGLLLITYENKDSFIDKTVNMRTPLYCNDKKLCNKCAGDLYYRLGILNIGLSAAKITSTIMNKSMKAFHDTTVQNFKINFQDYFID